MRSVGSFAAQNIGGCARGVARPSQPRRNRCPRDHARETSARARLFRRPRRRSRWPAGTQLVAQRAHLSADLVRAPAASVTSLGRDPGAPTKSLAPCRNSATASGATRRARRPALDRRGRRPPANHEVAAGEAGARGRSACDHLRHSEPRPAGRARGPRYPRPGLRRRRHRRRTARGAARGPPAGHQTISAGTRSSRENAARQGRDAVDRQQQVADPHPSRRRGAAWLDGAHDRHADAFMRAPKTPGPPAAAGVEPTASTAERRSGGSSGDSSCRGSRRAAQPAATGS